MRALTPAGKKIRVGAPPRHPGRATSRDSIHDLRLANVKQVKCTATRGSHAGLDQLTVDVMCRGKCVAEINVHLHHNGRALSVGSTIRVLKGRTEHWQ